MTTRWTIKRDWEGQTVAILASGPSMSQAVADDLRMHRCIVVNYTCRLAPWADMLVALDGNWPAEFRQFAGIRVTGVDDDTLDARCAGPHYETIRMGPQHVIETRISGLAAIRIATAMGAARIILAGFDPERNGHWYPDGGGQNKTGEPYTGGTAGLAAIIKELQGRGIVMDRVMPATKPAAAPRRKTRKAA